MMGWNYFSNNPYFTFSLLHISNTGIILPPNPVLFMWGKFISSYLSFTKKERTGIITLLVLIVIFTIAPFLFPFFIKQKMYNHDAFEREIALLKIKQADSGRNFSNKKMDDNDYPSLETCLMDTLSQTVTNTNTNNDGSSSYFNSWHYK